MKVLVIDDDEELCGLIRDYLGPLGYEIVAEHDGRTGSSVSKGGPTITGRRHFLRGNCWPGCGRSRAARRGPPRREARMRRRNWRSARFGSTPDRGSRYWANGC